MITLPGYTSDRWHETNMYGFQQEHNKQFIKLTFLDTACFFIITDIFVELYGNDR